LGLKIFLERSGPRTKGESVAGEALKKPRGKEIRRSENKKGLALRREMPSLEKERQCRIAREVRSGDFTFFCLRRWFARMIYYLHS